MYLTDLAFIEEGTPNYTEDGLVNFSKMRMVSLPAALRWACGAGLKRCGSVLRCWPGLCLPRAAPAASCHPHSTRRPRVSPCTPAGSQRCPW